MEENRSSTSFKINLWGDTLLVLPETLSDKVTNSGIIIPGQVDDKPVKGTVVAVGDGTVERPLDRSMLGITVMYRKFAGTKLKIEGVKYVVLRTLDVIADLDKDVKVDSVDSV